MRWLGFILRVAVVVFIGLLLVNQPGTANVQWHGYAIQTTAAVLVAILAVMAFSFFQFFRAWRWIVDGPRFWRLRQKINKLNKGHQQLEKGLVAIASGNAAEAGRLAIGARRLLGDTIATRLLQAQTAQLAGDHRAAKEIFRAMSLEEESAVLGYRGLIMAALREGQWDEAETCVEKLRRQHPHTPWLNLVDFELATRKQQWNAASEALSRATSARLLDPPRAKRHQAALLVAASEAETYRGHHEQALHFAEKALKHAPDWQPALINLAQKQLLAHHVRTALRTAEKAWNRNPHPQLAAIYQAAGKGGSPLDVHKQMGKLTRSTSHHPVSRMALAETALAADLWGEARRHLLALVAQPGVTQGVYRLLAKLERRESKDEQLATQWLMKAAGALPDPRWLCTSCGGGHDEWRVTCKQCGAFNTLEWQTPGVGRTAAKAELMVSSLGVGV